MADIKETNKQNLHPWEISRGDSILKVVRPYLTGRPKVIADIGCGDLYFSKMLAEQFDCKIFAVDINFKDKSSDNEKITKLNSIDGLEAGTVDIVLLMDVLEHVENPLEFLSQVESKMRRGGILLVTVPAYQHLFSGHDIFLQHYRRYTIKSLRQELENGGFQVHKAYYFNSSLYVLRLIQLVIAKIKKNHGMTNITGWKYGRDAVLTKVIKAALNVDFQINRALRRLPLFGLSVFAVCKMN